MKYILSLLFLIPLISFAYIDGVPYKHSYYNSYTQELYIRPEANNWERDHEMCHVVFFEALTEEQRNVWYHKTRNRKNTYCYSLYPYTVKGGDLFSEECFAEVCAWWTYLRRDDYEMGSWPEKQWLVPWYETWEYKYVSRLFE